METALELDGWLNVAIGAAFGLVSGLLTGFIFEARQARAARRERERLRTANAALKAQVQELQDELEKLNVNLTSNLPPGRAATIDGERGQTSNDELPERVYRFIAGRLDSTGTVRKAWIREHFARDHSVEAVDQAIAALAGQGRLALDGRGTVRIPR